MRSAALICVTREFGSAWPSSALLCAMMMTPFSSATKVPACATQWRSRAIPTLATTTPTSRPSAYTGAAMKMPGSPLERPTP